MPFDGTMKCFPFCRTGCKLFPAWSTLKPSSCYAPSLMHFHQDANRKEIKEAQNPCASWSYKIFLRLSSAPPSTCSAALPAQPKFLKDKKKKKRKKDDRQIRFYSGGKWGTEVLMGNDRAHTFKRKDQWRFSLRLLRRSGERPSSAQTKAILMFWVYRMYVCLLMSHKRSLYWASFLSSSSAVLKHAVNMTAGVVFAACNCVGVLTSFIFFFSCSLDARQTERSPFYRSTSNPPPCSLPASPLCWWLDSGGLVKEAKMQRKNLWFVSSYSFNFNPGI